MMPTQPYSYIDENSIKLKNGLHAIIYNGKMLILKQINVFGRGYETVCSFSFDDFGKLVELAEAEIKRIEEL